MASRRTFRKAFSKQFAVHEVEPLESRVLLSAEIFVGNISNQTIGEYTTSGATVNASLVSNATEPVGIAVSGSDLFALDNTGGTIGEYTTSGATVNPALISGLSSPIGIAVSGSNLFIINSNGGFSGTIGEYTTSGATVNASLTSGLNGGQEGIAISGSDLFVTSSGNATIGEYTTSGATVNASLVSGLSEPIGIAVSGSDLFVVNANNGTIGEYTTSGVIVNASLVSGLNGPFSIASFGSDLFVVNSGYSAIGEYTTSGATVNASLITGLDDPAGIAVANVPNSLVFAQQPTNTTVNTTLPPITVDVEDSDGNLLTTDSSNVTLAIASGPDGATLGGTTAVAAVNGVATFSDLSIPTAGDNYTLTATDGSDTPVTSTSFDISAPGSAQIFVTSFGSNTVGEYTTSGATVNASLVSGLGGPAGIALSGSDLFVTNSNGDTVGEYTTSGTTVNASLISSGLSGPNGIAVSGSYLIVGNYFGNTVGEYTPSGQALNAALISGFNGPVGIVASGPALFVVNNGDDGEFGSGMIGEYSSPAGTPENTSLITTGLSDPYGLAISGPDLFVANPVLGTIGEYTTSGATVNASLISGLSGQPIGLAILGSDLFVTNFSSGTIGEYTTSGATVNASLVTGLNEPEGITVAAGAIANLAFAQEPISTTTTATLGPITVDIEDSSGNLLTSDNSNVTIGLANDPTGATLDGTTTVAAVNGVATFSDLSVPTAGDGYTLTATDGSDTSATSTGFNIAASSSAQIFVTSYNPEPGTSIVMASGGTLGGYTASGATVDASLASGFTGVEDVALSGSDLFVTNAQGNGTIGEYTTSGVAVNASLISELPGPTGIAISGSDLFEVNDGGNSIGEYTTSGATVNASLVSGLNGPWDIAVSGSDLFVTSPDDNTIGEYTTSGATVNASLISGLNQPMGIAVSGSDLFVTNDQGHTVGEYSTSGTTVNASLISGLNEPSAIAVSGSNLFVTDYDDGTIAEYTTSGTTVNASLVSGLNGPNGIAVATIVPTPQLAFAQQPTNATTTTTFGPITVDVEDSNGNLLTNDNSNVTLAIANNPGGATLGGTTTVAAVNGVATFSDLSITAAGDGYTLTATDGSATAATSASFNIFPPPSHVGGLDPNFGVGGLVGNAVGFASTDGVAQDGAQSVIIGTIGASPDESFGITRYNADGSLDTAFGTSGVVTTSFAGTDDVPSAVAVLPGGQILVAGTATTFVSGVASGSEFAMAKYNADGSVDTSFGGGTGQELVSFSSTSGTLSNDLLHAMALDPGGIIYLAGSSDASGSGTDFAIAALNADGSAQTSFNTTGKLLLDFAGGDDSASALAVQPDGEVVVAGSTTSNGTTSIALARLLPTGTLDTHFGTKGQTITDVPGTQDQATSLALEPKGQIVVGGLSVTGSASDGSLTADFLVARYTSAGKIDPTFGHGPVITSFGQPAAVTGVLIESDGEIVASGRTTASLATLVPSELDVAIARYTVNGVLDTSFNGTGKAIISLSGDATPDAIVQSDVLSIQPLDATSDLNQALNELIQSDQGAVTANAGGELLVVGNSDASTVEAEVVTAGIDLLTQLLGTVPSSVVGGAKGSTSVEITEDGTTLASGSVTIDLSVASSSDGSGASSIQNFVEKISLKESKAKTFKLNFLYPKSLANGNYYVIATVDTRAVKDLNLENNTAASTTAVDIAAPFIDLSGSSLTLLGTSTQGKPASATFDLKNTGNVTADGKIELEFFVATGDIPADGDNIGNLPAVAVNLKALSIKLFREKLLVPSNLELSPGTYNLLMVYDPEDSLGGLDRTASTDNLLVSVGTFPVN